MVRDERTTRRERGLLGKAGEYAEIVIEKLTLER